MPQFLLRTENRRLDSHRSHWQGILQNSTDRTCTFVAEAEEGAIVGFVHGGKRADDADYAAEIQTVYLLQSQQGRGLGRLLLTTAARRLREHGSQTLFLWTHVRNPARGFYESLGGAAVRSTQRVIKGVTYDDVGYGWDEAALAKLIGD